MKISLAQTRQHLAYDPANPGATDLAAIERAYAQGMEESLGLIEEAAADADLVVTIEALNASIHPRDQRYDFKASAEPFDGPLMDRLSKIACAHRCHIVAGLYTRIAGRVFNSAVLFNRQGAIAGIYDKVTLPAGEDIHITPGNAYPVFETDLGKVGMLVCYDLAFPEPARCMALQGAELICVPTWGWEKKYGPTRAYENHLTVAAAMGVPRNQGIWDICDPSAIVDNMGEIIAQGPRDEPAIVSAEVDLQREAPPQYGAGTIMGMNSMRQVRTAHRRPDTYGMIVNPRPPLHDRYDTLTPVYRTDAAPPEL